MFSYLERIKAYLELHLLNWRGQCAILFFIAMLIAVPGGILGLEFSLRENIEYGLIVGLGFWVFLVLALVVPAGYAKFIRLSKAKGKPVFMHRLFLALYFFPILTAIMVGTIAKLAAAFY